ncbi:unnamed protein product [Spirodela intermedia]|uniref:Clp R domain-containing protein n=1 Tax=Spirodela intermedia TaxID=51605 RepID=A0A7I8IHM9_SPIIN|nr:unnamed protein product [Spirodela intermedia]CAA6656886.1 unnamed protein product [Spirodela intermedia]
MPTTVSAARQCLAGEAVAALDEATAIARRGGHGQTTSLHVISALLSLPSSPSSLLRDALSRARSAAYCSRVQFKHLEICFSMALDRLPSAASSNNNGGGGGNNSHRAPEEPPISNSLMAAIKRSQASQRRHPDTFHLYQQQQQNSSSSVKVELQQLVLSILDDPVVSRVFGEAGFRSYDIKFAILRPPPSVLQFPRGGRSPPLFLCNFSLGADDFDLSSRSFAFPFSSHPLNCDGAEENCRRIGEVLARKSGRNPLLVGVGASDAAHAFEKSISSKTCIEKDAMEFVGSSLDHPSLDSRFSDLRLWLAADEHRSSPGIIVSFGDLKGLVDMVREKKDDDHLSRLSYLVTELTRLLDGHPGRLWLMGSAATYEIYMKFLSLHPPVDKDWDLQLLPITTLETSPPGQSPRPNSLMGSSVPFGGFFPTPLVSSAPLSGPQQLQTAPTNGVLSMEKAKDDGTVFTDKVEDQREKVGHQDLFWVRSEPVSRENSLQEPYNKESSSNEDDRDKPSISMVSETHSSLCESDPSQKSTLRSHSSGVSTDLMLGTLHTSTKREVPRTLPDHQGCGGPGSGNRKTQSPKGSPPFETEDVKAIYKSMVEKVPWQGEAVWAVSRAVVRCRAGDGRRHQRGDIWLGLLGPDRVGKRKLASALAASLFGSREKMISVDLSSGDGSIQSSTAICGSQFVNGFEMTQRGKTIPWVVVFLENVDKADLLVQSSLLQAIRTGRLSDSHGREVAVGNAVFIAAAGSPANPPAEFSEEGILAAPPRRLKILVGSTVGALGAPSTAFLSKRRRGDDSAGSSKRARRPSRELLDLNLPRVLRRGSAEEADEAWMEEFLDEVDESVAFKPFDFDSVAGDVLREIDRSFRAAAGGAASLCALEIDPAAMEQILAAAWVSETRGALTDWVRGSSPGPLSAL